MLAAGVHRCITDTEDDDNKGEGLRLGEDDAVVEDDAFALVSMRFERRRNSLFGFDFDSFCLPPGGGIRFARRRDDGEG